MKVGTGGFLDLAASAPDVSGLAQEAQQVTQEGQELIREVWGVVADYYLDARGSGFNLDSWTKLRDTYLSQPLPTHDAAYRCASAPA